MREPLSDSLGVCSDLLILFSISILISILILISISISIFFDEKKRDEGLGGS